MVTGQAPAPRYCSPRATLHCSSVETQRPRNSANFGGDSSDSSQADGRVPGFAVLRRTRAVRNTRKPRRRLHGVPRQLDDIRQGYFFAPAGVNESFCPPTAAEAIKPCFGITNVATPSLNLAFFATP